VSAGAGTTAGTVDFPAWFAPLLDVVAHVRECQLSPFRPPADATPRRSAVLILFAEGAQGPDVLLTERAATLRSHAGQVAFPGGALDAADRGPVDAALREGREETGLDPDGVLVAGQLPALYLLVSDFLVTPVLAWWQRPCQVAPADPAEVARVARVPVAELAEPQNRFRVTHPSGYAGPGFAASGLFVWGFTAALLDRLLHFTGWERPWDVTRHRPLPLPVAGGQGPNLSGRLPGDSALPEIAGPAGDVRLASGPGPQPSPSPSREFHR
jgi:8-oxo-dGTP pyrophosphatase MutT (NUDIX family)